jgi:twitching motility two-component system response regulator PilH
MSIRKILVVDDSPTERFFYADLLARAGYQVVLAEDGEQAVALARSEKPELIVMDVIMPGQNGFQVTRAISRDPQTAHIPVILCTSKDAETDRYWGIKQGAREYLVKPVDPEQLLARIGALATVAN